jgi:hypothetical protein
MTKARALLLACTCIRYVLKFHTPHNPLKRKEFEDALDLLYLEMREELIKSNNIIRQGNQVIRFLEGGK